MSTLVCTLGASWQVIPEILGFLAPSRFPCLADHPERLVHARLREQHNLAAPTAVVVLTTVTTPALEPLLRWWRAIGQSLPLTVHQAGGDDEVTASRELILRAMLHATAGVDASCVQVCLAGGRKTMSADLQRAAGLFGCHALLHVLGPDPIDPRAKQLNEQPFVAALPAILAATIRPVVMGPCQRSDLVDLDDEGRLTRGRYPLGNPQAEAGAPMVTTCATVGTALTDELSRRERLGGRLLGNTIMALAKDDPHETWRCLYRLPLRQIEALRRDRLGPQHRDWLIALPKADLHCHLGGILDLPEQIAVGEAVWSSLSVAQQQAGESGGPHGRADGGWPLRINPATRMAASAWLLTQRDAAELVEHLWPSGLPRVALKRRHVRGFSAFEQPGDLMGSVILQTPSALWAYAQAVLDRCRRDGLAYLELRGSPHKYYGGGTAHGLAFLHDLHLALTRDHEPGDPDIRFICIADRRQEDRVGEVVRLALDAQQQLGGFVVGLDLAGDEERGDPADLATGFADAHRECLPVTIHAGEGEAAENIWKAAYLLHADRIGHGLSLADAPRLAARFRDRRICLELCPTSNVEVVGFQDPHHSSSADCPAYPWPKLWREHGLPLTICTDNPGISRTTLADEYLALTRMTPGGLSRWEVLALVRQAFLHAFLPAKERADLLRRVDSDLAVLLARHSPGDAS